MILTRAGTSSKLQALITIGFEYYLSHLTNLSLLCKQTSTGLIICNRQNAESPIWWIALSHPCLRSQQAFKALTLAIDTAEKPILSIVELFKWSVGFSKIIPIEFWDVLLGISSPNLIPSIQARVWVHSNSSLIPTSQEVRHRRRKMRS